MNIRRIESSQLGVPDHQVMEFFSRRRYDTTIALPHSTKSWVIFINRMIFCINKNNLAFCRKGKRNGSVVPPYTKELHALYIRDYSTYWYFRFPLYLQSKNEKQSSFLFKSEEHSYFHISCN